jgi:GNAT superfamily N-acetyltransferase
MVRIFRLGPESQPFVEPLCDLLTDAVHSGASVGFLAPLARETARQYWQLVLSSLGHSLCLWVAKLDDKVAGSVQLARCQKENGRHRAEIQKLFVLSACRGQGISRKLMAAAEAHARDIGCSLLVLDTLVGTHAETVYHHFGWHKAGEIPNYAATPDGELHATAYYYKLLAP